MPFKSETALIVSSMLMVSDLPIRIKCLENVYITKKVDHPKNILLLDYASNL